MKKPGSVKALEELGRERLSPNFFMRDFLYSEISNSDQLPNIPEDPDLAIAAGKRLCIDILEPINATFGRIAIRSAYRSLEVNNHGKEKYGSCAMNESNYGRHIWDKRDDNGCMGAMVCIVVPWYLDQYEKTNSCYPLAWWIHDNLRHCYSEVVFFRKLCAFNIGWHEKPQHNIKYWEGSSCKLLTKLGMPNFDGDHSSLYPGFPKLIGGGSR
jgi:hypothetical protein